MRILLLGLVVLAAVVLAVMFVEPFAPTARLEGAGATIGRGTQMRVTAADRGSGLARVEVRLVPSDGSAPQVLARQEFPRAGLFGSGVHEATLSPTLGATVPVPEGRATLEVFADDHSLLSALRRAPRLAQEVVVDVTPPTLSVVSKDHATRVGGSELAIFRVGPDTVTAGVQVGDAFFPASPGVFKEPDLRAVLFAIPDDAPAARPVAVATDEAGNRGEVALDMHVHPRKFAEKKLAVTDEFLQQKVPALLAANDLGSDGSLVDGYLRINRDLRRSTEARIRDLCNGGAGVPLWSLDDGALLRMPGAALSGFADRRTYTHDGTVIDHQTHLGYDIASLKNAVVPAAAAGHVLFTGPLGIYGNAVILDHGLGLFTLYGHLNEIVVQPGADVVRGDPVGKTGETGLAAGDHLHFSTMIHGIHVDPSDWWDRHWVGDHVFNRLAEHPRSAPPPAPPAPGRPRAVRRERRWPPLPAGARRRCCWRAGAVRRPHEALLHS
jgi:murein DD-endopeptidase MepM/ murein hydrolase activator NlpD